MQIWELENIFEAVDKLDRIISTRWQTNETDELIGQFISWATFFSCQMEANQNVLGVKANTQRISPIWLGGELTLRENYSFMNNWNCKT